ncbi:MAG: deaminase [Bacteroidota bacterium]|jgi:dCMP deaminase
MEKNFDNYLDALYYGDKGAFIIGLTGYTGSGNSTLRTILSQKLKIKIPGYNSLYGTKREEKTMLSEKLFREDIITKMDVRVYEKLARFWESEEWIPFIPIEVSKIIFAFLLFELINNTIIDSKYDSIIEYVQNNRPDLGGIKYFFTENVIMTKEEASALISSYKNSLQIYQHFKTSYQINKRKEMGEFITLLQDLGDQIRKYGKVVDSSLSFSSSPKNIFALPKAIDKLIRAYVMIDNSTNFVIDTFKNQYEIVYFKNMYSDFYLIGIMRDKKNRDNDLSKILFSEDLNKIELRERAEVRPKKKENLSEWITSQDIDECLKKADMFIANEESKTKYYEHLRFGIVKILTLVKKPGCVTPSQDERCIQLAMTAQLASGCISRQVGAVVLDKERRIIGVGWNDPPKTQIPCALRTCEELINEPTEEVFSEYERNPGFVNFVKSLNRGKKSFCFRTELANFKNEDKKAEYTRALHAEENALFQASRNVGGSLEGSTLYTTSSTCTLCAKKAYQLGVDRIVYIDEYYDIAIDQTLRAGKKSILVERFSGIVGEAYHKLYTAPMPEKSVIQLYDK